MSIIGEHNEIAGLRPSRVKYGDIIICDKPTDTTTKGKRYTVRGYHTYMKRFADHESKLWIWHEFVTLKNDYGYTVKINLNHFTVEKEFLEKKKEKDLYESNPLNILMEANGLIPQKYQQ